MRQQSRLFTRLRDGLSPAMSSLEYQQRLLPTVSEAAKWYRLAAEQGLASSQNNFGALLEAGDGVEQDFPAAGLVSTSRAGWRSERICKRQQTDRRP